MHTYAGANVASLTVIWNSPKEWLWPDSGFVKLTTFAGAVLMPAGPNVKSIHHGVDTPATPKSGITDDPGIDLQACRTFGGAGTGMPLIVTACHSGFPTPALPRGTI